MTTTVAGQFAKLDDARSWHLERARACASKSIRSILPDPKYKGGGDKPENNQSDCARYVAGLAGTLLQATFPPGAPFVSQQLSPELDRDPTIPDEKKQAIKDQLFIQDIAIQAAIEGGGGFDGNELVAGFHDIERYAFEQLLVAGDVCQGMTDNFRLKNYALNNYVVTRDDTGRLLMLITKEQQDPGALDEDELAKTGVTRADLEKKSVMDRLCEVYDRQEWNPFSKKWVTTREVKIDNQYRVVNTFEDRVPQKWVASYRLPRGGHYGDGLCDLNFGDIHSLDDLCGKILDHADLASWFHIFLDPEGDLTPDDMLERNGRVSYGRVVNGVPAHVGLFKADKVSDFTITKQSRDDLRESLGRAFLSSTGSVRDSERTTRFEIAATTIQELQNGLGGVYASIATSMQVPLFARARFECQRKRVIRSIPPSLIGKAVRAIPLTGLAALAAQARFQAIVSYADFAAKLGPQALARLNEGVLMQVAARYFLINEPGLVRSDEEMRKVLDQAIQAKNREAAGQQVVSSMGAIAENQAAAQTAAAQPQPQG